MKAPRRSVILEQQRDVADLVQSYTKNYGSSIEFALKKLDIDLAVSCVRRYIQNLNAGRYEGLTAAQLRQVKFSHIKPNAECRKVSEKSIVPTKEWVAPSVLEKMKSGDIGVDGVIGTDEDNGVTELAELVLDEQDEQPWTDPKAIAVLNRIADGIFELVATNKKIAETNQNLLDIWQSDEIEEDGYEA